MKTNTQYFIHCCILLIFFHTHGFGNNYIITSHPTSDPAPSVFTWNGETRVYLYTTQDKIDTAANPYPIDTIRCYSSNDMFHWRDEGVVLDEGRMPDWVHNGGHALWAPHVVYLEGSYRLYASEATTAEGDKSAYCFMAIAETPVGPFVPAPSWLTGTGIGAIDPFCFIDSTADSVRVHLVYRNSAGKTCFARMNDSGSAITGTPWEITGLEDQYTEGAWLFKADGWYYLLYATKPQLSSEIISCATAPVPPSGGITQETVWTLQGKISGPVTDWTNHTGVCRFTQKEEQEPKWYIFRHGVSELGPKLFPSGAGRCSAVEQMRFTGDAPPRIVPVEQTRRGVGICSARYDTIQIDRFTSAKNCEIESIQFPGTPEDPPGWYLGVGDNAVVTYSGVYFPESTDTAFTSVIARVGSAHANGRIEVHLDSAEGLLLGTISVPSTGGVRNWATTPATPLDAIPPAGIHELVLVIPSGMFYCNWIRFVSEPEKVEQPPYLRSGRNAFTVRRLNRYSFSVTGVRSPSSIRLMNIRGRTIAAGIEQHHVQSGGLVFRVNEAVGSGLYLLEVRTERKTFRLPVVCN